jgi:hypothetical protein
MSECAYCGTSHDGIRQKCINCGMSMPAAFKHCSQCGESLPPAITKCGGVFSSKIVVEFTTGTVGPTVNSEDDAKEHVHDLLMEMLEKAQVGSEKKSGIFGVKVLSIESEKIK